METCKRCLLCSEVCPNKILFRNDSNEMTTRTDRLCFKCGQCMAVCSTQSIIVDGLTYEHNFFKLPEESSYENSFYDMTHTRRAVRNFQDKPVPKELLEKIVEAISFAPPGFPPLKTSVIVVQDTELIRKALPYMIQMYDSLTKSMKKPLIRFL